MADAALAVTQEGGLFYLPEDTTTQHKDSTVQKRTFFKKFLDYFNDANKDKNHDICISNLLLFARIY